MLARRLTLRAAALVLAVALAVVAVPACSGDEPEPTGETLPDVPEVIAPDDTFRMGVTALDHLDPAYVLPSDQAGVVAVDLLFDGLTSWDPDQGAAVPALAADWEVDEARLVWTFRLREDAVFSDGTRVTAEDVKFSLERLARMGTMSLAGVRLEDVVGYDELVGGSAEELAGLWAVDATTLVVGLERPRASLPELLSSPLFGVVPKAIVEADPLGFDAAPVGSGRFRFGSREGDVVRFMGEGDRSAVGSITMSTYDSAADAYAAFEAGDLDWSVVPAAELVEAGERHGREAMVPFTTQLLVGFDLSDPELADVRFRTAISKAVDRDALLASPLVGAHPLGSLVPAGVAGSSVDGCGEVCVHDPDAARALVGEVFGSGTVPTIRVDVYDDPLERAVGEQVVASLVAVGIPAELVVRSYEDHLEALASGEVQVFSFSWVAMAPDASEYLDPLFLSDSPDNVAGLEDPLVDLAIRAARAEPDRVARAAQYAEVDRLVSGLVPMVPLAVYGTPVVVADRVEGFTPRPDGTFRAGTVSLSR